MSDQCSYESTGNSTSHEHLAECSWRLRKAHVPDVHTECCGERTPPISITPSRKKEFRPHPTGRATGTVNDLVSWVRSKNRSVCCSHWNRTELLTGTLFVDRIQETGLFVGCCKQCCTSLSGLLPSDRICLVHTWTHSLCCCCSTRKWALHYGNIVAICHSARQTCHACRDELQMHLFRLRISSVCHSFKVPAETKPLLPKSGAVCGGSVETARLQHDSVLVST